MILFLHICQEQIAICKNHGGASGCTNKQPACSVEFALSTLPPNNRSASVEIVACAAGHNRTRVDCGLADAALTWSGTFTVLKRGRKNAACDEQRLFLMSLVFYCLLRCLQAAYGDTGSTQTGLATYCCHDSGLAKSSFEKKNTHTNTGMWSCGYGGRAKTV